MVPFAVKANTTCCHNVTGSVGGRPSAQRASPCSPIRSHELATVTRRVSLRKLLLTPVRKQPIRSEPRAVAQA